jgi:hypothetical protein
MKNFGLTLVLVCCSALAACGSQTISHPSRPRPAGGSPAAAAAATTTEAAAAVTAADLGSITSAVPASGLEPFTCSLPVNRAASGNTLAQPTTARVGSQPGYDRIVFEYAGTALPALTVNPTSPPFAHDPSGLPLTVSGKSFLAIAFPKVPGIASGYAGPTSFKARLPVLTDLELRGDFEGVQSWVAGLSGPACLRVFALPGPSRLVIDLASASAPGLPNAGRTVSRHANE